MAGGADVAARRLLDWPLLTEHVGRFSATAKGRELVAGGRLRVVPGLREALALQAETAAVLCLEGRLALELSFGGLDTRLTERALQQARKGGVLSPEQLQAVVALQFTMSSLQETISGGARADPDALAPLVAISGRFRPLPHLVRAVEDKVDERGQVKGRASSELASVRNKLLAVEGRLKASLKKRSGSVVVRRGRICLEVPKAGGVPPQGSVLGSAGGFLFVEPPSAVAQNNELAHLREQEAKEVHAVCAALTALVAEVADDLIDSFEAVVELDVIAARGRYTAHMGGAFPELTDPLELLSEQVARFNALGDAGEGGQKLNGGSDGLSVQLKGLKHPLLLWTQKEEQAEKRMEAAAQARGSGKRKKDKRERSREAPEGAREVVPIDILVGKNTRSVVITGPNTGGKTATIKAFGLASLMSRSGLGLSVSDRHPAVIPCYDAVFADIGDEQSLTSSLSTFSGHLDRVQALLEEKTEASLVLLDEVGTGTDPDEGAALGAALLQALASFGSRGTLLTFATTHHNPLSALKYQDGRFENACVEFDANSLAPTYRLLWGVPGRSNALTIAERLELQAEVVEEARERLGSDWMGLETRVARLEQARATLAEEQAKLDHVLSESRGASCALAAIEQEGLAEGAAQEERKLRVVARAAERARAQLRALARRRNKKKSKRKTKRGGARAAQTSGPSAGVSKSDPTPARQLGGAAQAAATGKALNATAKSEKAPAIPVPAVSRVKSDPTPARLLGAVSQVPKQQLARWVPAVGQVVHVNKFQRRAKVVSVSRNSVTVDMGMMGAVKVPLSGVRR